MDSDLIARTFATVAGIVGFVSSAQGIAKGIIPINMFHDSGDPIGSIYRDSMVGCLEIAGASVACSILAYGAARLIQNSYMKNI